MHATEAETGLGEVSATVCAGLSYLLRYKKQRSKKVYDMHGISYSKE